MFKKMRNKNPLEDGELGVFNKKNIKNKVQLLSFFIKVYKAKNKPCLLKSI